MKRCWFGGALLLVLLAAGLAATVAMARCHEPIARELEQAAQCALESDWEQAALHTGQARNNWEKHRRFSAALADHEPMEEIDGLFSELEIWQQTENSLHYAAACAQLSQALRAISDAHAAHWWNVL